VYARGEFKPDCSTLREIRANLGERIILANGRLRILLLLALQTV
jgi:hypothetical protein